VNLPVVLANGSFQFNMAVVPNQVYYIDPAVATGYDYLVTAGELNFRTAALPTNVAGNFTGNQTPITTNYNLTNNVPLPSSAALLE
jgi:hypothetical protein